jgi:hypothetical protein
LARRRATLHDEGTQGEDAMSFKKIIIGAVAVVVVAVVLVVVLTGGDDNNKKSAGKGNGKTTSAKSGGAKTKPGSGSTADGGLHTVKSGRGTGNGAVAQASFIIRKPNQIAIRVSAAPKQSVRANWQLACSGGKTAMDSYDVTPPQLLTLKLPGKNLKTCVASVSAQLSGKGRVKVAVLSDR